MRAPNKNKKDGGFPHNLSAINIHLTFNRLGMTQCSSPSPLKTSLAYTQLCIVR